MNLPQKYHTNEDLEVARTKGQVVGWIQGGGAVILGGLVLNVLVWVPTVLVLGAVAWIAYGAYSIHTLRPAAQTTLEVVLSLNPPAPPSARMPRCS